MTLRGLGPALRPPCRQPEREVRKRAEPLLANLKSQRLWLCQPCACDPAQQRLRVRKRKKMKKKREKKKTICMRCKNTNDQQLVGERSLRIERRHRKIKKNTNTEFTDG